MARPLTLPIGSTPTDGRVDIMSPKPAAAEVNNSLLEREHVIGASGKYCSTLLCAPSVENAYVCAKGATVVLSDITNPHTQTFLMGHDADVSACDLSSTTAIIASGQVRSPTSPTGDAPVIVWETRSHRALHTFRAITGSVVTVRVSPDDAFVAAAGSDLSLCVWDVSTGEQIYYKRQGAAGASAVGGIAFVAWAPVDRADRRPSYRLAFNVNDRMMMAVLTYDFKLMRYVVEVRTAVFPAAGFLRQYACGVIDASGQQLLAGTTAGEMVTFSLSPGFIFRGCIPVASHGVHSIVTPRAPVTPAGDRLVAYCGAGDGNLRCLVGKDATWTCTGESLVLGRITSLSMSASASWLLLATSLGHMYRVNFRCNLTFGVPPVSGAGGRVTPAVGVADQLEVSHTAAVVAVGFVPGVSDAMVTAGSDNSIRVWNLNTYGVTYTHYAPAGATPTCLWAAACSDPTALSSPAAPGLPADVYAGFSDGSLRSYAVTAATPTDGRGSKEAWRKMAHRGATTCISGNAAVVVTGGDDGRVCVWSRKAHDLLIQFNDHNKPVVAVACHVSSLELIFSLGADKLLNTYGLRAERRVKMHSMPRAGAAAMSASAAFLCMTQNAEAGTEKELFTGTTDGRIICWDPDVPDVPLGSVDVASLLGVQLGMDPRMRPELRVTSIAASPSSAYIAVVSQDGFVMVLRAGQVLAPSSGRASSVATRAPPPVHGMSAAAFASAAGVADMAIMAWTRAFSPFAAVRWSPDGRQIVAVAADGCISIFNWYA